MSESQSSSSASPTRRRRWSIDHPPTFALEESSDYGLHQSIMDFLRLYEDKKDLLCIISEHHKIPQQREKLEKKRRTGVIASTAFLAVGAALALASAPLTGGLSLVAMGLIAATGVAAGIRVNSTFTREIKNEQKKKQEAEEELINTLKELETRLNKVETNCEERRENERDANERERLLKLENHILKFKYHTMSLQLLCANEKESVFHIIDEVETVQTELHNIMTEFEDILQRLKHKYPDHQRPFKDTPVFKL